MKIIKNKKEEFNINKFKSNSICYIKNENKYLDCSKNNLEIERASEEFILQKRRKRKKKETKKNKRYKFKCLYISDYNQLFIKKSKICDNNDINKMKKSCIDSDK